jgi:hypothetical protein
MRSGLRAPSRRSLRCDVAETRKQRWAPKGVARVVRTAWSKQFAVAFGPAFHREFTGWTWLFRHDTGLVQLSGPAGQRFNLVPPDGYLELEPAHVAGQLLGDARRLAGVVTPTVIEWARWSVEGLRCPKGHEMPGVGPAAGRAACPDCERVYDIRG